MIIYGVTGTRNGATSEQLRLLREIASEELPDVAHHGDCVGVDAQFAQLMRELCGAWIVGHPPTNPRYRAWFPSDETWPEKDYLVRDEDVVLESQRMFALPREDKEIVRSGTWATVRIARRLERPLMIIYRDGRLAPERW